LPPPAHPGGEVAVLAWKVIPDNTGASMGMVGFNAVEFLPDQPDEMGLWPKGVCPHKR